jgi:hypothetical protein
LALLSSTDLARGSNPSSSSHRPDHPVPHASLVYIGPLAPLFFLYAILAARYVAIRILFAREPYADEASLADPRLIFFQVEVTTFVVLVYIVLAQIAQFMRAKARTRAYASFAVLLLAAALTWFAIETIGHRTRGVTATDPYAYAQMAADLVERGTPLHSFPLFQEIAKLGIAWYPIEHVGYRLFDNLTGNAPTVWPIGGSIWIAGFYRALGEEGLYLATPIAAIMSLLVFALFVWVYLSEKTLVEGVAITALSIALLATSWEQVDRSIVPLVDAQAQLFSTLTLLCAFYSLRSKRLVLLGTLTGLSLAAAYHVRHTQVLLAIPILLTSFRQPIRERLPFHSAALSAILLAIFDLYYHHLYFGGWLVPESNELALFSLSNVVPSLLQLSERFCWKRIRIFDSILSLWYVSRRDDALRFSVLAVWISLLVASQLPYAAIKMRDLLPEFPAVVLLTAYGLFALARDVRAWAGHHVSPASLRHRLRAGVANGARVRKLGEAKQFASARMEIASWRNMLPAMITQAAAAFTIFLVILLPSMRARLTIQRPFQPAKITLWLCHCFPARIIRSNRRAYAGECSDRIVHERRSNRSLFPSFDFSSGCVDSPRAHCVH